MRETQETYGHTPYGARLFCPVDELIFFPSRCQFSSVSLFYVKLVWQFLVYALLEMEALWAFHYCIKPWLHFFQYLEKSRKISCNLSDTMMWSLKNIQGPLGAFLLLLSNPWRSACINLLKLAKVFWDSHILDDLPSALNSSNSKMTHHLGFGWGVNSVNRWTGKRS